MPTTQISSGNYVSFAHRLLWDSSQLQLAIAKERPDDTWMLHLSAGLLAAAAFEAYLNYAGEELLPEIWAEERTFFATEKYKGTYGKLKRIAEEVQLSLPPRDRTPLAGVIELQTLRDRIVHARPKKKEYRQVHKIGQWPKLPSTWLYQEATPIRVKRMIVNVEELAVQIHRSANSVFFDQLFGAHPFHGISGFATHSVETEA